MRTRLIKTDLVALTGYSRAGKDEAAKALIEAGWERRCFGDIIKRQLDPFIQQHLGFSAFTQDDIQKTQIRGVLEQWGEANYDQVFREFFDELPVKCVNTRLCRPREAAEWRARGGLIVEIVRRRKSGQRYAPHTEWEMRQVAALHDGHLIDVVVENDGTIEELMAVMRELCVVESELHPIPLVRAGSRPRVVRCRGVIHADRLDVCNEDPGAA